MNGGSMTAPFRMPRQRENDDAGEPLRGARLFFYDAGTSAPRTTYRDAALTQPHAHPVQADSGGLFPAIWVGGSTAYKVVLSRADGVIIWSVDGVNDTQAASTTTPTQTVSARTGDTVIATTDMGKVIEVSAPGSPAYAILPAASGVIGQAVTIRNALGSAAVVIQPSGLDLIDGAASLPLTGKSAAATLLADAGGWKRIGAAAAVNGLWKIVDRDRTTPPSSPTPGQRYIAAAGAISPWTATRIYESSGVGGWIEYIPEAGDLAIILGETIESSPLPIMWNGSAWIDWRSIIVPGEDSAPQATISEERASGSAALTAAINQWTDIPLNTVGANAMAGLSLLSGVVTIPVGAYDLAASVSVDRTGTTAIRLVTDTGTVIAMSPPTNMRALTGSDTDQNSGVITLNAAYTFDANTPVKLQYYATNAGTVGFLRNVAGQAEISSRLVIRSRSRLRGATGLQGARGDPGGDQVRVSRYAAAAANVLISSAIDVREMTAGRFTIGLHATRDLSLPTRGFIEISPDTVTWTNVAQIDTAAAGADVVSIFQMTVEPNAPLAVTGYTVKNSAGATLFISAVTTLWARFRPHAAGGFAPPTGRMRVHLA